MPYKIHTLLFLFLIAFGTSSAQTTQIEFGKNRVQYHNFFQDWSTYESQNFISYWYGEAQNVGQSVVQMAEFDFKKIEDILEYRMNQKIEIIVYTDVTDLKQSNIGAEDAFVNNAGQTKIVGNKMFVYFNGDHTHLRRQVKEGIAGVYLNAMLFGSNLQEIVQNAVSLNLPRWFKDGLISFMGEEWSPEKDAQLRDALLDPAYKGFEKFAEENPKLAGHALWYFIKERYGVPTVSNLLYLTRINRSIESGFLYVLGSSFERTVESLENYYVQKYKGEVAEMDFDTETAIPIKNRKKLPITDVRLSPDGKQLVYVQNDIGKFKVFLQDMETGVRKKILKEGHRNPFQETDYDYPLLAFSPSGMELIVLYEHRDVIQLLKHDLTSGESVTEQITSQYQRVYSMDYLNNSTLVLTAAVRGQSDLFYYYLSTRQTERITNDFWDDLDARVVNVGDQKGILFSSNRIDSIYTTERLDTILPITSFDIYYLDPSDKSKELVRITNTPLANERQPIGIDTTWFGFTTDISGVENRMYGYLEDYINRYDKIVTFEDGIEYVMHPDTLLEAKLDSAAIATIDTVVIVPIWKKRAINHVNTNYAYAIDQQTVAPRVGKVLEKKIINGVPTIFTKEIDTDTEKIPTLTLHKLAVFKEQDVLEEVAVEEKTETKEGETEEKESPFFETEFNDDTPIITEVPVDTTEAIDVDNYYFQTEFDDEELPSTVVIEEGGAVQLEETDPTFLDKTDNPSAQKQQENKVQEFKRSRIIPYRLQFRTDYVTSRVDNEPLFDGLNSFSGDLQQIGFTPAGLLFKGNVKDLFEDYELEGGIRVPTTFNGAEYFITYNDRKKRLDKRYSAYRKVTRTSNDAIVGRIPPKTENIIMIGQYQVRYPFDVFTSLRGMATVRTDRTTELATSPATLETPSDHQQRLGLRGEYVFDNTLDVSLNIKNGTRYKFYGEIVKRFDIELNDGVSLGLNDGFMGIVGLDARHYQPILKYSVLAGRIAATTTFGSEKILYYLGGVDNWLFRSFNEETPPPVGQVFAYQTVASNLRGFQYNIRNGNSFALANAELRVPILRYIWPRSTKNFVKNFQVVGFYDIGTAWEGTSPFNDENPLNTIILVDNELNPNVEVKVRYFRDPIVQGYGVGARMTLFGYFLRFDYGWGVETGVVQDPRFHFSTGFDF